MTFFIFAFVCSGLGTALIVYSSNLHDRFTADHDLTGVQKSHSTPVPRIGGLGIFVALWGGAVALLYYASPHVNFYLSLMAPCSLVFSVGLWEDVTKRVSVKTRLIATMLAALIGCLTVQATIHTLGIPPIDVLLRVNVVALVFTIVAVGGVANAINLIDGFNGLAATISVMALLAIGLVAHFVGDITILVSAAIAAGAICGFLIWNYPRARIFLGDGGAYLIGFVIAELCVLLHERHRQVSALFPLLVVIYPVFETLFTIYRRKFVRGRSPGAPDALHLHQLINKRVVRWRVGAESGSIRARGNAMTSPYLWLLNGTAVVPAVLFWNRPNVLLVLIFVFMGFYVWLYQQIVKFRTPRWLFPPHHTTVTTDKPLIAISANTSWYIFNFRRRLIESLQKQGYRVLIIAPYDAYAGRFEGPECIYAPIKIQNSGLNPLKDLSVIRQLRKLLKQHRPMAFLTYTPKVNIYGAIAARQAGIPVITNVSGLGRAFIKRNWVTYIVENLYRIALSHPIKIFFQNEDDKAVFLELGLVKENQTSVLPGSGVDTNVFTPQERGFKSESFIFLLVARMLRDKGVGEYVEAARQIKLSHPEVRFQLLGFVDVDNPSAVSSAEIDQWVAEGIVEYLGATDDVRAYYAKADCAVLPSYREGTPRTLLEAASMGLPIITTDAPGCRNTIDDGITGYLCKTKDVTSLIDALSRMLALPEVHRLRMGTAGRRKMQQQFSENIVLEAYLRAVQNIDQRAISLPASVSIPYSEPIGPTP